MSQPSLVIAFAILLDSVTTRVFSAGLKPTVWLMSRYPLATKGLLDGQAVAHGADDDSFTGGGNRASPEPGDGLNFEITVLFLDLLKEGNYPADLHETNSSKFPNLLMVVMASSLSF